MTTEPHRSLIGNEINAGRRDVLTLALIPAIWLLVPESVRGALATFANMPAISMPDRPSLQEFIRLSEVLTGRNDLDPDMAHRIHALIEVEPHGPQHVTRVYERIRAAVAGDPGMSREKLLDPQRFDSGERWFIGHLLVTWYTGVYYHAVGNGRVGFEAALMHRTLADMRAPPSICGRKPGFWAAPPDRIGALE